MSHSNGNGGLLGPDGGPLVTALRHPQGRGLRLARNKAITEAWLEPATRGDKDIGRGDHNWAAPPKQCLTQAALDRLRSRGIAAYVSPGQFILADLTGKHPRIRQRRPLAERYVELVPQEETKWRT